MVLRVFGALFAQGKASQLASMDDWPLAWHGLSLKIRSICFGCRRMVRMICSRMSCSCKDCSPISIVLQYSKQHASSQLIRLSQNLIFLSINLTFLKVQSPKVRVKRQRFVGSAAHADALKPGVSGFVRHHLFVHKGRKSQRSTRHYLNQRPWARRDWRDLEQKSLVFLAVGQRRVDGRVVLYSFCFCSLFF